MKKSEKGREYVGIEVREETGGSWDGGGEWEGDKRGRMELDGNAIILAGAPSSLKLTDQERGKRKKEGWILLCKNNKNWRWTLNYVVGKEASSTVLLSLDVSACWYICLIFIYTYVEPRECVWDNALCVRTYRTLPVSSLTLREGVYCNDSRHPSCCDDIS